MCIHIYIYIYIYTYTYSYVRGLVHLPDRHEVRDALLLLAAQLLAFGRNQSICSMSIRSIIICSRCPGWSRRGYCYC